MKTTFFLSLFICSSLFYGQHKTEVTPVLSAFNEFQNVRDFTMSLNGQEAYITIQSPLGEVSVLVQLKKEHNKWSKPSLLPFSGVYKDLEPFLLPNNLRLYFASNRPLPNSTDSGPKDFDIWYVERKNVASKWSAPINLGPTINTASNEFYPTIAENNNLYFTSDSANAIGKDAIFYSEWVNNIYTIPVPLSNAINTVGYEFNSYIAKDESFLIFSGYNREDGVGSGDLYISFKNTDNQWTKALNLGNSINSKQLDYCPFVDENSGQLFFTSKRTSFKETSNFKSIKEVVQEISKSENGFSRIYKVPFNAALLQKKNSQQQP